MDDLRAGCPWDKKQTLETLRYLTIEETYELSDAILEKDMDGIRGELGDLMLHLVFYAKIGSETNNFDIADVLNGICDKLVKRHPHIYGDVKVANAEDVSNNWEKIKLKEKDRKSVLSGVPKSLPAMVKAYRMQEKARGVGFDWENTKQVWEKVNEEMEELQVEVDKGDQEKMEKEFGDLLFSLINYARFIGVNPEDALERTNKKFIRRFKHIEDQSKKNGKNLQELSLKEMDAFWDEAKLEE
jgi:XTP/dITP diphosphohydrolase